MIYITQGSTGSVGTGPTSAYHGLHYKYIETSTRGTRLDVSMYLRQRAILESSMAFQGTSHCHCFPVIFINHLYT